MSTASNRRRGAAANKPRPARSQTKLDPILVEEPETPVVSVDFGAVAPRQPALTPQERHKRSVYHVQHERAYRTHKIKRKARSRRKATEKMKHRVWSR